MASAKKTLDSCDIDKLMRRLRMYDTWLSLVNGGDTSPYTDEPWLSPDGVAKQYQNSYSNEYFRPGSSLAVPHLRYTDEEERTLRRREDLEEN